MIIVYLNDDKYYDFGNRKCLTTPLPLFILFPYGD